MLEIIETGPFAIEIIEMAPDFNYFNYFNPAVMLNPSQHRKAFNCFSYYNSWPFPNN